MRLIHWMSRLLMGGESDDNAFIDLRTACNGNRQTVPTVRKVQARLRLCRIRLRKAGKLTIAGYSPPNGNITGDCQAVWRQHGWEPPTQVKRRQANTRRPPQLIVPSRSHHASSQSR